MKIGIISTLGYTVPPKTYGGTEIVVYYLSEQLVKAGHDVTLFACEGSKTKAKLDKKWAKQITGSSIDRQNVLYTLERINYLVKVSDQFDVMHNNEGFALMSHNEYFKCPLVTTFHASPDKSVKDDEIKKGIMRRNKIVSISYAQRKGFPEANYIANVYHGTIDFGKYKLGRGGDYLVWIGRFNPYKGAKEAIEIAERTNHKIFLAGKIEPENKEYYEKYILPKVDGKKVIYLGEINISQKNKILAGAKAFLMPISWEEPFGLVMIEAMACGTPVIGYDRGSVAEVVKDKETGFVVGPNDIEGMCEAVERIGLIDRQNCRDHVKKNFSPERMSKEYVKIYEQIAKK